MFASLCLLAVSASAFARADPSYPRIATIDVDVWPKQLAVRPDGAEVWVSNLRAHTLSIISTASNTVVHTVRLMGQPVEIVFTRDGARAFVSLLNRRRFAVLDTRTLSSFDGGKPQ